MATNRRPAADVDDGQGAELDDGQGAELADVPAVGEIRRYPVTQSDGKTTHQLILITGAADETGAVRGFPLGYEDHASHFARGVFAD